MNDRITSRVRNALRRLRHVRGSGDLTVTLLMTAAGAAMVGMTVPTLFKSSDTAARTFDKQVKILERGAGGGSSGGSSLSGIAGGNTNGGGFELGGGAAKSISGPSGNVGLNQGSAGLSQGSAGLSQGNAGLSQGNAGLNAGQANMGQGGSANVVTPGASPVVNGGGSLSKSR